MVPAFPLTSPLQSGRCLIPPVKWLLPLAQKLEQELILTGALDGLPHEFIIRQGNVSEELELVIKQKKADLVVVGMHGRGSLGKFLPAPRRNRSFAIPTASSLPSVQARRKILSSRRPPDTSVSVCH